MPSNDIKSSAKVLAAELRAGSGGVVPFVSAGGRRLKAAAWRHLPSGAFYVSISRERASPESGW